MQLNFVCSIRFGSRTPAPSGVVSCRKRKAAPGPTTAAWAEVTADTTWAAAAAAAGATAAAAATKPVRPFRPLPPRRLTPANSTAIINSQRLRWWWWPPSWNTNSTNSTPKCINSSSSTTWWRRRAEWASMTRSRSAAVQVSPRSVSLHHSEWIFQIFRKPVHHLTRSKRLNKKNTKI